MIYDFHCRKIQEEGGKSQWRFYQKYLPDVNEAAKLIEINPLIYEKIEGSIIEIRTIWNPK